jgi:Ca2+-transporting ATPase
MLPDGKVVPLGAAGRAAMLADVQRMALGALRCLALAKRTDLPPALAKYNGSASAAATAILADPAKYADLESGLTFVGLAALHDPPRPEVAPAIYRCRQAGIRVIVITGDNQLTAESVCRNINVFGADEDLSGKSLTGREFVSMTREQQVEFLAGGGGRVFSRAEPRHKQDIVRLLKDLGDVVAMTGDGVNDAPALKLADIGIAMGIAGTEVAKEAADMVLADDNFSSIVSAVAEGRSIYNNMKAFIRYMISSNIGEVAAIFLTAMLGLPENLIPVQLLWVNLVTDGPPATALGFNKADKDIMLKPPRKSNEALINNWVFFRYMVVGLYVGLATIGAFCSWYMYDSFMGIDLSADGHSTVTWAQLTHWQECPTWDGFSASPYTVQGGATIAFDHPCEFFTEGKAKATTLALTVIVVIEMANALNALSEDASLLEMPPWTNPWLLVAMVISIGLHCVILYVPVLATIFQIVPLSGAEWALVLLWAMPVVLIDEVLKALGRAFFGVRKIKLD